MTQSTSTPIIATAYLLADGDMVFLRPDGTWQGDINAAFVAASESERAWLKDQLVTADRSALIVDGYEIEVTTDGNSVTPLKMREQFRLNGRPTIDYLPASATPTRQVA